METLELFAVRDRKGTLKLFTGDSLVKNQGKGYWLSEYNSQIGEMEISKDSFPEIRWDDSKPTRLVLVNPENDDDPNDIVDVPGCIEVYVEDSASQYNTRVDTPLIVFIDNISYLEPYNGGEKTSIHLKNGQKLLVRESVNQIKRAIYEHCQGTL